MWLLWVFDGCGVWGWEMQIWAIQVTVVVVAGCLRLQGVVRAVSALKYAVMGGRRGQYK